MRISSRVLLLAVVLIAPISISKAKSKPKVVPVFLADPTIFYTNGLYYLYGTEPNPEFGFPVFVSKDLIKWTKPKNAASNGYALMKGKQTYGSTGFWAPQIIANNDKFYMLYTANENIALAESTSPYGPFTQKNIAALPSTTKQIDPYLFFDEDGKKYLYHVRLGGGNKIFVAEFKDDFSGIKEETLKECITAEGGWEDTKRIPAPPIAEGPTVLKHKGLYYLFYSSNDFRNIDYAVGYATSESPMGPWTKNPNNPIINRTVIGKNGTGHGDVFKDEKGNFYYVFHSHNSESEVLPRQTFIIGLKFKTNDQTKVDEVVIDKSRMIIPNTHK